MVLLFSGGTTGVGLGAKKYGVRLTPDGASRTVAQELGTVSVNVVEAARKAPTLLPTSAGETTSPLL